MNRVASPRNAKNRLNGSSGGRGNSGFDYNMFHRSPQPPPRFNSTVDKRLHGVRGSSSNSVNMNISSCNASFASPKTTTITNNTGPTMATHTNDDSWYNSRGTSSRHLNSKSVPTEEACFDTSSIMLKDLRVGPASPAIGSNGAIDSSQFSLPSLARRVSSETKYSDEADRGSYDFDVARSSRNNYHNGSPTRMNHKHGHNYSQRQSFEHNYRSAMLKEPPPNYLSPRHKQTNVNIQKKAPPPSPSFKTHDQGQETSYQPLSNGFKSPSQTSPPPSTPSKDGPKHRENHRGIHVDRPRSSLRVRPARMPSIPRAIDVDRSFSNYYNESDSSQLPPMPPLSPISSSSSMFSKRVPIESCYPSRESIEKQIPDLPSLADHFPTIVDPCPPTDRSVRKAHTRPSTGSAAQGQCRDAVAAAAASTHHRTDTKPTNTILSGLPKRTAPAVHENRPEKPLRINSQFPSQLQLRQQQQRRMQEREQEQMQLTQDDKTEHPTNPLNQTVHTNDLYKSLLPCPLPSGNGLTNGVTTGISSSNRHRPKAHVPPAHGQEYDLHFSSPPTKPLPTRTATAAQPTNKHQRAWYEQNEKKIGDLNTATADESSSRSLTSSSAQPSVVEVEIYPGVSHVLRGARETARAAKRNFIVSCVCVVCTVEFSSIADAAFVICPTCVVVNALGVVVTTDDARRTMPKTGRWGVGLGFIPDHH